MVRNLKYENQIVDQPIHDGVTLQKWIHDGVVVWENGVFKNVYLINYYDNTSLFSMILKDKKAYNLTQKYHVCGNIGNYIFAFSGVGYDSYFASDDVTNIGESKQSGATFKAMASYNDDTLLSIKADNTLSMVKISNNEFEINDIGKIEMGEHFTSFGVFGGLNAISIPYLFLIKSADYVTETHQFFEKSVVILDSKNRQTQIISTQHGYLLGHADDDIGNDYSIQKQIDVNGFKFLIGTYSSRASTSLPWSTNFAFIRSNGKLSVSKFRPPEKTYELASNVATIKYNGQYWMYLFDGNTCHLHKVNEDLELLSEYTLPSYLDLPVDKSTGYEYSKVRLYFNTSGMITESDCLLVHGFQAISESVYFDDDGAAQDTQTIEICVGYSIYRPNIYIHIDNLFFNSSTKNFATYVET